jgi:hypothetical protein
MKKVCSIEGCHNKHDAKGLCKLHYKRWRYGYKGNPDPRSFSLMDIGHRLEEKTLPVPEAGCHIWMGRSGGKGYGGFKLKGKILLAHRVSWEYHNGPIPDGLCVLHKCDTPLCINPNHLFLGTIADNNKDCARKGRNRNGHTK